uniref:Uncharacterized protein n=1 Tax=Tetranychus urticae TaxID=32264 RepID=T1KKH4_TETUR
MAQGKMKVKTVVPKGIKVKKVNKSDLKLHQTRKGAPIKPKLASYGQKLYNNVEKAIRKNIESEMRSKAGDKKPEPSKSNSKKKSAKQ